MPGGLGPPLNGVTKVPFHPSQVYTPLSSWFSGKTPTVGKGETVGSAGRCSARDRPIGPRRVVGALTRAPDASHRGRRNPVPARGREGVPRRGAESAPRPRSSAARRSLRHRRFRCRVVDCHSFLRPGAARRLWTPVHRLGPPGCSL